MKVGGPPSLTPVQLHKMGTLFDQGKQHARSRGYSAAIRDYRSVLELDPDNNLAKGYLAHAYFMTNKIKQAQAIVKQLTAAGIDYFELIGIGSEHYINNIGPNTRIDPPNAASYLRGVNMDHGSQIIKVPDGSSIRNINLRGGASYQSPWAVLRGAVLKFGPKRDTVAVEVDGHGLIIPSGHTVMDEESLSFTINIRNGGRDFPKEVLDNYGSERLYMVHASYCHPDQLFLPQGIYTNTVFSDRAANHGHLQIRNGVLSLKEKELLAQKGSFNIFDQISETPVAIAIQLCEGGQIILMPQG